MRQFYSQNCPLKSRLLMELRTMIHQRKILEKSQKNQQCPWKSLITWEILKSIHRQIITIQRSNQYLKVK